MQGWIKLHRKILENPIVCKDSDYFATWMYLLLNATHTEYSVVFKGEKITLKPGQLITGRKKIADKLKVSESKIQRILKAFECEQQIEQQPSNQNRLISIVNWEVYQTIEQQNKHQMDNKQTSDELQINTNNNIKKVEKAKIVYSVNFEAFWKIYPRKKEKAKAFKNYEARLKNGFSEEEILKAATAYAEECRSRNTEERFIKLGATFLSASTPFTDYLKEGEENGKPNQKRGEAADYYRKFFGNRESY